jgi:hypothetical protein
LESQVIAASVFYGCSGQMLGIRFDTVESVHNLFDTFIATERHNESVSGEF